MELGGGRLMAMVSADGWRVEKVIRTLPGELPVARLRVSWRGYWQADCLTTEEVEAYVDLSTLVPSSTHLYSRDDPRARPLTAREVLDAALAKAAAELERSPEDPPPGEPPSRRLWAVPSVDSINSINPE